MRPLHHGLVTWLLVSLLFCASAHARPSEDQACRRLFREGAYRQASTCFEGFIPSPFPSQPTESQRVLLGRRIRNAVMSYRKAAQATKHKPLAAYLRERALRLMRLYLRQKLFENTHRKNSALLLLYKLKKHIGYCPVTILTPHPNSRIHVIGYHFTKKFQGRQWTGELRPGPYRVIVDPPHNKPSYIQTFNATPETPILLQLKAPQSSAARRPKTSTPRIPPPSPKPPPPRIRALTLSLLLVGGVAGATSLVLFIAGNQIKQERDLLYKSKAPAAGQTLPPSELNTTRELTRLQDLGGQVWTASALTLGLSAAGIIGGSISLLFDLQRPNPRKNDQRP